MVTAEPQCCTSETNIKLCINDMTIIKKERIESGNQQDATASEKV